MTTPRRSSARPGQLAPLTPDFTRTTTPTGTVTRDEAIAETMNLKRILAAERRTNQRAQKALTDALDSAQSALSGAREAYLSAVTPRPVQR